MFLFQTAFVCVFIKSNSTVDPSLHYFKSWSFVGPIMDILTFEKLSSFKLAGDS